MDARAAWNQAIDIQLSLYLEQKRYPDSLPAHSETKLDTPEVKKYMQELEERKLREAEPIFVTEEMSQLISTASGSFVPEPFQASDPIVPIGFLLFAKPIEVIEGEPGDQIRMDYGGISWITVAEGSPTDLQVTLYDCEPRLMEKWSHPLWPSHVLWIPTGVPCPSNAAKTAQLIGATFRLLREFKPASRYSSRERPDRAARRAARRAGLPEREVLVVRLRRERRPAEKVGNRVDYAYRFMVSGHWRQQWFPSISQHRQVWISPYVKGSSDKPFKPPQRRVFHLFR